MKYMVMSGFITILATALLGSPSSLWAQETTQQMQQKSAADAEAPASALDEAISDLEAATPAPVPPPQRPALLQRIPGLGPKLSLIDVSLNVLLFAGFSSENDESISTLQGGGHDPKTRGYTLGQAELSLSAVVDPYFTAEAHILSLVNSVSGESTFEVEEAFLTTTGLPLGLQLEVGYFLTEFGIVNPQHPHFWDWLDMPVVNSRMFGGDGMRQAGFRASWLLNTPWFSQVHFGIQNANGVTMASFLGGELAHAHGGDEHGEDEHGQEEDHDEGEEDHQEHAEEAGEDAHEEEIEGGPGIGGRPIIAQDVRSLKDFVYLMRWENAFDLSDELTAVFGASSLLGPNSSGPAGSTWLYGLDMKWRWTPADSFRGYPFLTWQTEYMRRQYDAAAASMEVTHEGEEPETAFFPADTLEDWGVYTQLLYGFQINWAAGLRFEYANGRGRSYTHGGRTDDPFRNERYRVSPLLSWRTSEFVRIRLQYNYDNATHLEDFAHSVWLGFEWLYGAHPAHRF